MKNFLFSALACVAFAGSAFASDFASEVQQATKYSSTLVPCYVSIIAYDKNGDVIDSLIDTSFGSGGSACDDYGASVVKKWRALYPGATLDISIIG